MENNTLLIIDGSSLLSTAYHATVPKVMLGLKTEEEKSRYYDKILKSPEGLYTNGLLGFFRTMHSFLDNQKPKYIVFTFDITRNTFRRKLYPLYKANRGGTDEPLRQQFNTALMMLKECKIVTEKSMDFEADDLSGSIAEKYYSDTSVRIYTKDRDYFQLVNDEKNIRVWLYMDESKTTYLKQQYMSIWGINKDNNPLPSNIMEFTEETVKDFYGVHPKYVIDRKALEGDSSDNIPGVKGVGEKATIPLINEYNTVENLYEAIHDIDDNKNLEKELPAFWKKELGISRSPLNPLINGEEDAYLSKKLATIKTDCPLNHTLEEMNVSNIDFGKLKEWYEKLGMNSLLKNL